MASSYRIADQEGLYFVTWTIVQWIDIFTRQIYRDIVVDSLKYCQQKKGLQIHAWVIMSNHVHAILSSDRESLSGIIRDCKRHTSKAIISAIQQGSESRATWLLNQLGSMHRTTHEMKNFKCGCIKAIQKSY